MVSRRFRGLVIALVLAMLVAACGGGDGEETGASETAAAEPSEEETSEASEEETSEEPSEAAAAGQPCEGSGTIGFSQPLPDQNFELLLQILEQDTAEAGHEVISAVANLDPGKQIADIQTMLQQGIDVLVVGPANPDAIVPAIEAAEQQGVPIVAIDAGRPGPYATNLQPGHAAAGRQAAEYLAEVVGDGGVVAIEGPEFAPPLLQRNQGLAEVEQEVGLNVLDRQVNREITPDFARNLVETWKTRFGADVAGIWSMNDVSTLGAISALTPDFQPAIVSINGEPPVVEAIRAGQVTATFDLLQVETGHLLAWAVGQAFCGEEMPEQINIELAVVDESNVDEWQPWEEKVDDPFTVELEERDGETFLVTG